MYTSMHFLLQLLLFQVALSQAGLKPRIFLPQHQEYCDFGLVATSCFHPSSSLEAVTLINGPLPSFSNTLSWSFPVFSSMHHQHHFPLSVLFVVVVFSSSLPTPFSFPISCFVFLSLSQIPTHTLPVLLLFFLNCCSLNRSHISLPFPIFLQKTKIHISPHQPALHPESTLILAPFFFHPFLSCFYLGFLLFSLLEYLFLDTPTCCLFWDRALLCIPGSYVLPVYSSSSLMLKTVMGHHARLCPLYQEPLFLEVPWDDLFSPLSSLSSMTQGSSWMLPKMAWSNHTWIL